jgi:threonylcarbamoyladenosine tRNA methylthiotransferase MtaB
MQSGSDPVLRRMHRRGGARRFVDRCHLVRESLPQPAFTTDVIVGFPGETDQDFAATCRACEDVGFSKIHIFPFSPRRGTPAATMTDQVAADVKAARSRTLAQLEADLKARYCESLRGRRLQVLVEAVAGTPGRLVGTTCRYAPLELAGPAPWIGRLIEVTAGPASGGIIQAVPAT